MNKGKIAFSLILILIIGLSFRIYNLGKYDFWSDEAISLIAAKYTLSYFALTYLIFPLPIFTQFLFDLLLKFWLPLGKSEFVLRLLPLTFGFLSIIGIYLVGKALFDKKTGLIAAFLLAISPFHIYYAQELRAYTLFCFLSLASIYFLIKALKEDKFSSWVWFVFSTILCLYAHNMALLLLVAENAYFFLFYKGDKKMRLSWRIGQLTILLFYVPWLSVLIYQVFVAKTMSIYFWVPQPSLQAIIHTFNIFNLGYHATKAMYLYAAFVFFPLFLLGLWEAGKEKARVSLLLCWLFIPIITAIFISFALKPSSIYLYRAFINISPAYYLIVASGLSSVKKYALWIVSLSLIIILSAFSLKNQYNNIFPPLKIFDLRGIFVKKDYKSPIAYIKKDFREGDVIAHSSRSTLIPFMYYYNNKVEQKWVMPPDYIDWLYWKRAVINPILHSPFTPAGIKQLTEDYQKIWLVFSGWEIENRESPETKQWLDKNCKLLKEKDFKGVSIYLYKVNKKNVPK